MFILYLHMVCIYRKHLKYRDYRIQYKQESEQFPFLRRTSLGSCWPPSRLKKKSNAFSLSHSCLTFYWRKSVSKIGIKLLGPQTLVILCYLQTCSFLCNFSLHISYLQFKHGCINHFCTVAFEAADDYIKDLLPNCHLPGTVVSCALEVESSQRTRHEI